MPEVSLAEKCSEMKKFDAFLKCWNHNTQMHLWRYVFASQYLKDKRVLDVACGVGYGSDYLSRCGAKEVVGVDLDQKSLQFARSTYIRPNLKFVLGNALALPIPEHSFDVVVSFETIEHIREQGIFLKDIRRVLTVDGIFICSTPNRRFSTGHIDHVRELTPAQFYGMLEKYFRRVERYGQYPTLADREFELSESRGLKFRLKRQKAVVFRKISHWMNKSSFGIYLKSRIKWVFRRIIPERSIVPVEITDELINGLNSKYAVRLLDENYPGVFFGMVAACKRNKTEMK